MGVTDFPARRLGRWHRRFRACLRAGITGRNACATSTRLLVPIRRFHVQVLYQERILVRQFFDQLGCRLARAVAGAGFGAGEDGRWPWLAVLQWRGELEAGAGDPSVVRVGSSNQGRWDLAPLLDIVVRRIGVERLEFARVVRRAVIVGPEAAG